MGSKEGKQNRDKWKQKKDVGYRKERRESRGGRAGGVREGVSNEALTSDPV